MMSGMIGGMTQPSPKDEMAAYDQLPVTLRRALGKAGDQFSASQMLQAWKSKRFTCRELIEMIEEQDTAR